PALPDAVTANARITSHSTASTTSAEQPSVEFSNNESSHIESLNINSIADMVDDKSINHSYDDANETGLSHSDQQSPVTYSFDSTAPDISKPAVTSLVNTVVQKTAIDN